MKRGGEEVDYASLEGRVICVEGNIAVGKTTLLTGIEAILKRNDVTAWAPEEEVDARLMGWFYEDPKKFQPLFQQRMMLGRIEILEETRRRKEKADCAILLDTGLLREYAFSEANKNMGYFEQKSYDRHIDNVECLVEDLGLGDDLVDRVVFLDSDEDRCMSNSLIRKRKGETLDIGYLRELKACYEKNILGSGYRVLRFDCTGSFPDPANVLEEIVKTIR